MPVQLQIIQICTRGETHVPNKHYTIKQPTPNWCWNKCQVSIWFEKHVYNMYLCMCVCMYHWNTWHFLFALANGLTLTPSRWKSFLSSLPIWKACDANNRQQRYDKRPDCVLYVYFPNKQRWGRDQRFQIVSYALITRVYEFTCTLCNTKHGKCTELAHAWESFYLYNICLSGILLVHEYIRTLIYACVFSLCA
jgi:hypothetical protein